MNWIILLAMLVGTALASARVKGFARLVLWSAVALAGSMLFRGGRVLVLPFVFVLILEGLYWAALPRSDGEPNP